MADFWKSNPKHYCKYCNVWVQDNPMSRQIHDNGLKHKDKVKMFMAKAGEKKEKEDRDAAEVRIQLRKIEQMANKAYYEDMSQVHQGQQSMNTNYDPLFPTSYQARFTPSPYGQYQNIDYTQWYQQQLLQEQAPPTEEDLEKERIEAFIKKEMQASEINTVDESGQIEPSEQTTEIAAKEETPQITQDVKNEPPPPEKKETEAAFPGMWTPVTPPRDSQQEENGENSQGKKRPRKAAVGEDDEDHGYGSAEEAVDISAERLDPTLNALKRAQEELLDEEEQVTFKKRNNKVGKKANVRKRKTLTEVDE